MRLPTLPLLLLSACAAPCGGPQPAADDDRSVIERRLARAETAGVQAHVTAETVSTDAAPSTDDADQAAALAALGYLDEGEEVTGVHKQGTDVHRAEASSEGLNAFTMGARPGAVLVDMTGAEVHRWDFAITDAWPGLDHPEMIPEKIPWRRIQVLENGDLIGIWSGYGLARITADARLIWGHWLPVHHDLHVYPDGRVVTLTAHPVDRPALSAEPVIDDRLTWLSADGYPERSVSVLDALMAHPDWDRLWAGRTDRDTNDVLHTNTVFVLEEDHADAHPAFTAGRVLVSMRALSALALIDPTSGEAVWVHTGPYVRQHDPQVTADGKLWVFDNQGAGKKRSRMLRYDLATNKIEWRWTGTPDHRFFTRTCGHAQPLQGGNLLVTSSEQGVAYEVTPEGEVVWSYHVPQALVESRGAKRVRRFFAFQRLPASWALDWIAGADPG